MQKNTDTRNVAKPVLIITASLLIAIFDAWLKYLAISRFSSENRANFPIDFALYKNTGIAFDIALPQPYIFIFSIVAIAALAFFAIRLFRHNPQMASLYLAIIIGAVGNFIDRIIHGFTTDYLIIFSISAINLSDILILTGAFLLIWYSIFKDV